MSGIEQANASSRVQVNTVVDDRKAQAGPTDRSDIAGSVKRLEHMPQLVWWNTDALV
jgi:hypothetical protein